MQSAEGYSVHCVLVHSGHEKSVYWTRDLEEARAYARMVVRLHGRIYGVYIQTPDKNRICEWQLNGATNDLSAYCG